MKHTFLKQQKNNAEIPIESIEIGRKAFSHNCLISILKKFCKYFVIKQKSRNIKKVNQ